MATTTNRIINANVYVGSGNMLGKIKEIEMPQINFKMVEHQVLGMLGTREFPTGVDKLTAKIAWNSFYKEAIVGLGDPFADISIQVRASLEMWASGGGMQERQPVVIFLRVTPTNLPGGNFKQNEGMETETNLACSYARLTINGEDIYEVDVTNNILKIAGDDKLAVYRQHIGQ